MNDVMGVVLTENNQVDLGELTNVRALGAVPVACNYRMIDFILSSFSNSGVQRVGVTTQYNYKSLMYHLGSGKPWNLNKKDGGLFILPPYVSSSSIGVSTGSITTIYGIMDYIKSSRKKYVIISDCNCICNIDFHDVIKFHTQKGADITLLCVKKKVSDSGPKVTIEYDDNCKVCGMQINSGRPKSDSVFMNICVIEKTLLESLVEDCVSHGETDFITCIVRVNINRLNIFAYNYEGFCSIIYNIKSYFDFNMSLLNSETRNKLFTDDRPVYTNSKDILAAKYGEAAEVKNCIIADGCKIDGNVSGSVMFRGVNVRNGCKIKNCIILHDTIVEENVKLENVIIDKHAVIGKNEQIIGRKNSPLVIEKNAVI